MFDIQVKITQPRPVRIHLLLEALILVLTEVITVAVVVKTREHLFGAIPLVSVYLLPIWAFIPVLRFTLAHKTIKKSLLSAGVEGGASSTVYYELMSLMLFSSAALGMTVFVMSYLLTAYGVR